MTIRSPLTAGLFTGRSLDTQRLGWFSRLRATFVSTHGASFSSGATANTKGAWAQFVASVSSDVSFIVISPQTNFGTDQSLLLDIGIGASGSEVAVASNIAVGGWYFNGQPQLIIPARLASGSRLSFRAQGGVGGRSPTLTFSLYRAADHVLAPTSLDVLGSSTSDSRGTAMSGGSGTWVEIAAATTTPYQAIILVPSYGTAGSGTGNTRLTLGVGAAGAEVEIGSAHMNVGNAGIIMQAALPEQLGPFGGPFPIGTRIAVKHNIASTPGRIQACVIGVPFP